MSKEKPEANVMRDQMIRDSITLLERQLRDAKNAVNAALRALEFLKAQL